MGGLSPLLRVLVLWRGQARWLLAGAAVSVAAVAAGVLLLGLSGGMVAALAAGVVIAAAASLRGLGALRVGLRYLERLVTHDATFRALAGLRVWFFRGLARNSAGGIGFRRSGDLLARLVGDVEALDGLYLRVLVPLASAVLLGPALVAWLAGRGAGLALAVGLLFALAALALPWWAARAAVRSGAALSEAAGALRAAALDAVAGLREVRAFGAEERMAALVRAREAVLIDAQGEAARRASRASATAFLCAAGAVLAVLAAAGSDPAVATAAFVTVAAFEVVAGLPRAGALAGHAAAAARRVLEAAEAPALSPDPAEPAPAPAGTGLRFEAVRFRWQPDRPAVLDGLTLDVPEGARVAILGPSGSGKSTLAALALRVVAPQAGRVLLGGADVASLAASDLRARVAWLGQATHLFDDTIRANLLLGRPDATEAELWAALDDARLGEVVRALPDGLDTWVGESGARLSGGQGRRLALARTLLTRAPVTILDEPAAGLDADTEREFLRTLNDVAPGRTVVLIAHRLTGVERLDRIYRLQAGVAVAAAA